MLYESIALKYRSINPIMKSHAKRYGIFEVYDNCKHRLNMAGGFPSQGSSITKGAHIIGLSYFNTNTYFIDWVGLVKGGINKL